MSPGRVVLLTHRGPAAELLARELARQGLPPALVVVEERALNFQYGRLSRTIRGIIGDRAVNRLAQLRLPPGAKRALAWERAEQAAADAWLYSEAAARGLGRTRVDCPIIETASLNAPACVQRIRLARPDVMLVFGTRLLRRELIAVPPKGSINMHSSLLPYDRGSMPEFWQCLRGDLTHAGITFHLITEAIDAGDVLAQIPAGCAWPINPYRLRAENLLHAVEAFPKVAAAWLRDELAPQPQPEGPPGARPHRMGDITVRRRMELWRRLQP